MKRRRKEELTLCCSAHRSAARGAASTRGIEQSTTGAGSWSRTWWRNAPVEKHHIISFSSQMKWHIQGFCSLMCGDTEKWSQTAAVQLFQSRFQINHNRAGVKQTQRESRRETYVPTAGSVPHIKSLLSTQIQVHTSWKIQELVWRISLYDPSPAADPGVARVKGERGSCCCRSLWWERLLHAARVPEQVGGGGRAGWQRDGPPPCCRRQKVALELQPATEVSQCQNTSADTRWRKIGEQSKERGPKNKGISKCRWSLQRRFRLSATKKETRT